MEAMGVALQKKGDHWIVAGGPWQPPSRPLDCRESGTTYRFFSAMTSALGISCKLTGEPSLLRRPMDDRLTSQLLSGRLLAAPLLDKETVFKLTAPPVSRPYVQLTLNTQKKFGVEVLVEDDFKKFCVKPQPYRPAVIEIEGDWSAAAVWLAASVLTKGVILDGLNPNSLQGDRAIVDILREMGADIFWKGDRLTAKPSALRAVNWDLSQTPDLFPIVSVLNTLAGGNGQLTGTERLRFKESDRVEAMEKITNVIDSRDHRIVMAAAVLNLTRKRKIAFKHKETVAKSYPGFWKDYEQFTG